MKSVNDISIDMANWRNTQMLKRSFKGSPVLRVRFPVGSVSLRISTNPPGFNLVIFW